MPKPSDVNSVLILGSGGIKIAEAAEFDYSGSQAIKAMKEEGIRVILVNPNVATIQTSMDLADEVYLLPVTADFVEKVIEKERPDGILLGFGGQTALNCGVELERRGVLRKYGVRVLGTPIKSIVRASDRGLFRQLMVEHGIPVPPSEAVFSVKEALDVAERVGYPVMVRVAFNLGGAGSLIAFNHKELSKLAERALAQSPIGQILVEKYLHHWKEVEFEVVRDHKDNAVAVACLENMDPMGIHTGDSIVVAPSQTLTNREYQMLRDASLAVTRAVGVIGECNVQLALDPCSEEFYVIEVNPRMSRSSALASKATGYPLAYIAAKLALGYTLPELINKVTGITSAHFEPALDYVVVKMPRWDFSKFLNAEKVIGTEMRSIGEVMAVGRCFEEALQKAIRMLDIGKEGLVSNPDDDYLPPLNELLQALKKPSPDRLFLIAKAIKAGLSIEHIYNLTGIDPWYLYKIRNIVLMERKLRELRASPDEARLKEVVKEAKQLGFSDRQIAFCLGWNEDEVRKFRKRHGILPVIKRIDTLAAEWPAVTNYLYLTYGGDSDDVDTRSRKKKVLILGAGVFRIGVSVEFDWCVVELAWALKKRGIDEVIVLNYNPETVSTDWDVNDKLYFDEISLERVLDIYEKEQPLGIVTCVGGQIANNLAPLLEERGVKILGSNGRTVDMAEDRRKFSSLLDKLGIPQPVWAEFDNLKDIRDFCLKVGFPVIVRPSYVLSGSAMRVIHSLEELRAYLKRIGFAPEKHKLVVSKFFNGAKEVEVDCVSDGARVLIGAVIEHLEEAGVHSGDATMVIPPISLSPSVIEKVKEYTYLICSSLNAKGPVNIQYLVRDDDVYVIECNLRASRSMPFVSKTKGINLMDYVADVLIIGELKLPEGLKVYEPPIRHWGVKTPQFSWSRLRGAYPTLGVEMRSTGEVASLGLSFHDALLKSWLSAPPNRIPRKDSYILLVVHDGYVPFLMKIWEAFHNLGYKVLILDAQLDENGSSLAEYAQLIKEGRIGLTIVLGRNNEGHVNHDYVIRRLCADFRVPLILNPNLALHIAHALNYYFDNGPLTVMSLREFHEGKTHV
ncbi:MAG: carbamoyl-phosphate synthase (glutamine-hydrolyzing) large subunit [Thermoprotei archaeon]|nr:carbamoyl-phosphate synthase (glutamine-hydrolyzing) large subunit [Thermoprotei archaeon]